MLSDNGLYVIRYDNRDVGKSTNYGPGIAQYDIVDMTEDALSILDGYQIETAHFVGMSLGGLISQIAALKYPNRISKLTLISTGPWGDSDPNIPEMDKEILNFHSKAGKVDWADENEVVKYMLEGASMMSGKRSFDQKRAERLIKKEFQRANNYISMFNHATLQGGEAYYGKLSDIKQPTLIIHGTDDRVWYYDHAKVVLSQLQNAKLITLEGTGHELHQDDWDTIIDGIVNHY
jgi:pimeloyl-ACP methyl ester carboxylesterase